VDDIVILLCVYCGEPIDLEKTETLVTLEIFSASDPVREEYAHDECAKEAV